MNNGTKLLIIRTLKGLNQGEFAEICGVSRATYNPIEKGEGKIDSLDLDKMLKAMDMTRENFDNMSSDLVLGKVTGYPDNITRDVKEGNKIKGWESLFYMEREKNTRLMIENMELKAKVN